MNGASTMHTTSQRRKVSAIGEMWPTAKRLATALPPHMRAVKASSRYACP